MGREVNRKKIFTKSIIRWNLSDNSRIMPWKGAKDAYIIWLSEIILQQTRVEQGLPYFERFIKTYPSLQELAAAPEDEVFRLWQGLGYYARCRNMIATARRIALDYGGKFPTDYKSLLHLKGIGPYTAAAIAAFAYNLPHAVVDGNVFRVLSRYFGVNTSTDSSEGKKYFSQLANELLDSNQPAVYNQAIMDFGSLVCKPQLPLCGSCPLNKHCVAFLKNQVNDFPVKSKKIQTQKRFFHYFIIKHKQEVYIVQRKNKDIWQGLYEFPVIELNRLFHKSIFTHKQFLELIGETPFKIEAISAIYTQQLTHQYITARFFTISLKVGLSAQNNFLQTDVKKLTKYAFPQVIVRYLNDIFLNIKK